MSRMIRSAVLSVKECRFPFQVQSDFSSRTFISDLRNTLSYSLFLHFSRTTWKQQLTGAFTGIRREAAGWSRFHPPISSI